MGPNQCPSGALARRDSWSLEKKLGERCNCRKGDAELDWGPVGSERGQERTPGREGIGNGQPEPLPGLSAHPAAIPVPRLCRELEAVLGPHIPKSQMDLF